MAAIKSFGNLTTEQKFARVLRAQHVSGWRRHLKLPGTPDFSFPKPKVAIFIDGCFWHFCPRCTKIPKKNVKYWIEKSRRNKERDRKVSRQLRDRGWRVLRFWEHSLDNESAITTRIKRALRNADSH